MQGAQASFPAAPKAADMLPPSTHFLPAEIPFPDPRTTGQAINITQRAGAPVRI